MVKLDKTMERIHIPTENRRTRAIILIYLQSNLLVLSIIMVFIIMVPTGAYIQSPDLENEDNTAWFIGSNGSVRCTFDFGFTSYGFFMK